MNIISPKITVIGKRYYRINPLSQTSDMNDNYETNYSGNLDEDPCDYEDEYSQFDISKEGAHFCCKLSVPSMFFGFIIGKRSESKKRIELDTKTNISVPKQGSSGKIIVKGQSHYGVSRAVTRILELVEYGRKHCEFTHFFSIAANNQSIIENYESFKQEVLLHCIGDRGVQENLFQKSFKLHLTLTMLVLGDHDEILNATHVFDDFKKNNADLFEKPLRVRLKGLEYMNDDPCEVRVLYSKVDKDLDHDKLQDLADKLVDYLLEKHVLSEKEYDSVTLHMTLLNRSFLSKQDLALDADSGRKSSGHFDCSNIINQFSDWDFGVLEIREIHLSKRFTTAGNTYYTSAATFQFG